MTVTLTFLHFGSTFWQAEYRSTKISSKEGSGRQIQISQATSLPGMTSKSFIKIYKICNKVFFRTNQLVMPVT